jgi:ATP-dependent RNA helicase DeaD
VHRIGRTGRQGRSGRAISFASGREVFQIRQIERYVGTRIHRARPPTADEVEEARANAVLDKIRATLQSGEFKRQDQLIERLLEEGFSSTDIASALLHHLQGGESAPPARVAREDAERGRYERSAPPPREQRYRQHEDRPRQDRREPPHRRERPPERPRPALAERPAPKEASPAKTPPPEVAHPKPEVPPPAEPRPVPTPKANRQAPQAQTCLHINIGTEMGVSEGDIVGTILGETGLPRTIIGAVDIRERHLFVHVASEYANSIISKLNRTQIKGRRTKVKVA